MCLYTRLKRIVPIDYRLVAKCAQAVYMSPYTLSRISITNNILVWQEDYHVK